MWGQERSFMEFLPLFLKKGEMQLRYCAAENSIIRVKVTVQKRRNKYKIIKYKNHLVKSKQNTCAYLQVGKAKIMFQTSD